VAHGNRVCETDCRQIQHGVHPAESSGRSRSAWEPRGWRWFGEVLGWAPGLGTGGETWTDRYGSTPTSPSRTRVGRRPDAARDRSDDVSIRLSYRRPRPDAVRTPEATLKRSLNATLPTPREATADPSSGPAARRAAGAWGAGTEPRDETPPSATFENWTVSAVKSGHPPIPVTRPHTGDAGPKTNQAPHHRPPRVAPAPRHPLASSRPTGGRNRMSLPRLRPESGRVVLHSLEGRLRRSHGCPWSGTAESVVVAAQPPPPLPTAEHLRHPTRRN
jgi:hypothetical protein